MNIRISVPASAQGEETGETSRTITASLNGIAHDELFSEYFIDHIHPLVSEPEVSGGKLIFHCDANGNLWARVDYLATKPLTAAQNEALIDYTLGQLSDGIGNNFVQEHADRTGVFVNMETERTAAKLEVF